METDPWQRWRKFTAPPGGPGDPGAASAPPMDFAERFNRAARAFLSAADTAAPGAAPAGAARVFGDALRDLFATLQSPLNGTRPAAATGQPDLPMAPLAFGAGREHQLRWQRLTEAWQALDEAQRRLQRLWLDALRNAADAFASRLGRPPAPGQGAEAIRGLYDAWIDCAEDAYSRIAHGAEFCQALADSVNAGSRWRRELKAIVEQSSALLDLPTRSEINTLQRRLRLVEAQLRATRQTPDAPAPAPKIRPRRKKTR